MRQMTVERTDSMNLKEAPDGITEGTMGKSVAGTAAEILRKTAAEKMAEAMAECAAGAMGDNAEVNVTDIMPEELLPAFRKYLEEEEKSPATVRKYLYDLKFFLGYAKNRNLSKELMKEYKESLSRSYRPASVNSMIASVNRFLRWCGMDRCTVRAVRVQQETFRTNERELSQAEYFRLLRSAGEKRSGRLALIIETLASTGMRISELKYISVQAVQTGRADVFAKRKQRCVLLPRKLCVKLKIYADEQKISSGSIFLTRGGRPVDRSNIWKEMKQAAVRAGISRGKVFPHNLRHLFAVTYFRRKKDLPHLADLLGHSSINTTRIYTRISIREQSRQIEGLGLIL